MLECSSPFLLECTLRFLRGNLEDLAVVIVSKTFTTGETMLNSKTMKSWLVASLGQVGSLFNAYICLSSLSGRV